MRARAKRSPTERLPTERPHGGWRGRSAVAALLFLAVPPLVPVADACEVAAGRADAIVAVGPRGELTLRSGTTAFLSGIRWPDDARLAAEAAARAMPRAGAPVAVAARSGPDRWGRIAADASADGGDLAAALVASGLALADAGEVDAACRPDLLALEEAPRREGRGVWAAPVVAATDGAGLAAREGAFVVAQGRVLGVAERERRAYLNFTNPGQYGLSVTVPKRTWRIMQERGLTAATLKGRLVRVRGTVEIWRAPMLDIAAADMIEVLAEDGARQR